VQRKGDACGAPRARTARVSCCRCESARRHFVAHGASRIDFTQINPDEKAISAVDFLKATVAYAARQLRWPVVGQLNWRCAVAYYKSLGAEVDRVMIDNGSCYKSLAFAKACKRLRLKDIRRGRRQRPGVSLRIKIAVYRPKAS
jgi:transposase InsO family protein